MMSIHAPRCRSALRRPRPTFAPTMLMATALLAPLAIAGCGDDAQPQVQQRQVPTVERAEREPASPAPPPQPGEGDAPAASETDAAETSQVPGERLVAAIAEHEGQAWVFQLHGPARELAPEAQHFVELLQSAHFHEGEREPHYQAPDGWTPLEENATDSRRYQVAGTEDGELRVTPLPSHEAEPLTATNRWRAELGLPPIEEDELDRFATPLPIGEVDWLLVDLIAEAQPEETPSASAHDEDGGYGRTDRDAVIYDVPSGWMDRQPNGMRLASLAVVQDGGAADVSIIALGGDGGGLLANVNRWRDQLNLDPVDAADLDDLLTPVRINQTPAQLVQLHAEEPGDGQPPLRMLVGVQQHAGQTWFVRMVGPSELVEQQRDTFERFLESIRWPDGDAPATSRDHDGAASTDSP